MLRALSRCARPGATERIILRHEKRVSDNEKMWEQRTKLACYALYPFVLVGGGMLGWKLGGEDSIF